MVGVAEGGYPASKYWTGSRNGGKDMGGSQATRKLTVIVPSWASQETFRDQDRVTAN